jgi:hypothetical protein
MHSLREPTTYSELVGNMVGIELEEVLVFMKIVVSLAAHVGDLHE